MENKMTLEQFAALLNASDLLELEIDDICDIIVANNWTPIFYEWYVCHDGKQMIYFDDNGQARVTSIEELGKKQDEEED